MTNDTRNRIAELAQGILRDTAHVDVELTMDGEPNLALAGERNEAAGEKALEIVTLLKAEDGADRLVQEMQESMAK